MRNFYVVKERPEIPKGWVVCNAPRPIIGHKTWQGDFIHGIFYASIDPGGEHADIMFRENKKLDAWELVYVDMDKVKDTLREKYPRYAHKIETIPDMKLIETYHVIMNERG